MSINPWEIKWRKKMECPLLNTHVQRRTSTVFYHMFMLALRWSITDSAIVKELLELTKRSLWFRPITNFLQVCAVLSWIWWLWQCETDESEDEVSPNIKAKLLKFLPFFHCITLLFFSPKGLQETMSFILTIFIS